MEFYAMICFYTVTVFIFLETVEILRAVANHGKEGIFDYVTDVWNLTDWVNFTLFFITYFQVPCPAVP